jgi:uncharacterized protein YfiM (DUF2279 family)
MIPFSVAAQWSQTSFPESLEVRSLATRNSDFYAGTYGGGILISTDTGTSWRTINVGLTNTYITSLAVKGGSLFAGTDGVPGSGPGVLVSTNNGGTWAPANSGLGNTAVLSLGIHGTNLFAGTFSGVYYSANNGMNWAPSHLLGYNTLAFAEIGTSCFAGTNAGVWISVNNGVDWTWFSNLGVTFVTALAVHGTKLFVATEGDGIFLSTNNGATWTPANSGLTSLYAWSFAVSDTNLFVGTYGGVFLSRNFGASWTNINQGLIGTVKAFAVIDTNLFAGSVGVWKRSLNEILTSVENPLITLPTHSSLDQNYPNPFNPVTTISFNVASRSFVSLRIFDALGREAETLVSEELNVGKYARQWDATGFASGVYLYRLTTGLSTETKKLILVR